MQQLRELINGYQATCILVAATRLGIFDALADCHQSILALAQKLNLDSDRLRRLIRVLRSYGLIGPDDEKLCLTPEGLMLAPAHGGLSDRLRMVAHEYLTVWSHLDLAITQGKSPFEGIFHESPWQHRLSNPAIGETFNRKPEASQLAAADEIVGAYDFSRFSSVADIGGGAGHLLSRILARHSGLSGVLFDLPYVVAFARSWLVEIGLERRCELQCGSFLNQVPDNMDLYILKHVLHNWDDQSCVVILKNCAAAMRQTGCLLILEIPLKPQESSDDRLWLNLLDIHMMLVHGGRERTLEEYDRLLQSASLQRTSHRQIGPGRPDVIEARYLRNAAS